MNVNKRLLSVLALVLFTSSYGTSANAHDTEARPDTNSIGNRTFLEYCEDETASDDSKYTIYVLMSYVKKQTCQEADEALADIRYLSLNGNEIVDVAPLATLTSLRYLYLYKNEIVDVSPLASLTSLIKLRLDANKIVDVSPLASLKSLTFLNLVGNQVVDVSPLSSLTSLDWLYLYENQIADLSPLTSLKSLTYLGMYGNPLGTTIQKTPDNCPVGEDVSNVLRRWCSE